MRSCSVCFFCFFFALLWASLALKWRSPGSALASNRAGYKKLVSQRVSARSGDRLLESGRVQEVLWPAFLSTSSNRTVTLRSLGDSASPALSSFGGRLMCDEGPVWWNFDLGIGRICARDAALFGATDPQAGLHFLTISR